MSRVRPGVREVRASPSWPTSALMRLDLPTFERPTTAISGSVGGGKSAGLAAEVTKRARTFIVHLARSSACCSSGPARSWLTARGDEVDRGRRIERRTAGRARVARRADGGARRGRGEIDEAERAGDLGAAHQIVLGVRGAGAVARLAADLDGDRRPGGRLAGTVAGEAA